MKDYNEILNYILEDKEIDKIKEKYKKEQSKETEINDNIHKTKIYFLDKIGSLFNEFKVGELETPLFIIKRQGYSYYGIRYILWFKSNKKHNPKKDLVLLDNTNDFFIDFSNLKLIKDFYDRMKTEIKNKYEEKIDNIIYENDKNKTFYNMVLKKMEAW